MVQRGHLAQGVQVGNFARVNMVAGNGLERFGREGQVHGVAGFGLKIDDKPGEDRVHGGNFAEAPTAMITVAAVGQGDQGIDVLAGQFSGRGQFFKFFFHRYILASHRSSDHY